MGKYLDDSTRNLKNRFDAVAGQRTNVEVMWEECSNYVVPFRGEFFRPGQDETEVDWRRRWIYDSTPVEAAQTLASSLNGSLTSPLTRWYDMKFRLDELNEDKDAKEWIEECVGVMFDALRDSNFNLECDEAYLDLVGFGNTVVVEEIDGTYEDFRGLDFKTVPIKECHFEEDYKGRVKRFYREVMLTPVQLVDRFGLDGVPTHIRERAQKPDGATLKEKAIFAIYERQEVIDAMKAGGGPDTSKPLAPEARPYGFKWFMHDTAEQLGETGGYYEMPAYVVRWRKVSGSQWGHGPSHVAMGTILTLNELTDMILAAVEKAVDPATVAEDRGIMGALDLGARGLTIVRDIEKIKTLESQARYDVGHLEQQDMRDAIRRIFFVDQLELKDSPAMTATEVQVRYELMQRLLGPTLGRLQHDFLDPLLQRTFNILYRAGKFPQVPESVMNADAQMDVEYTGPIARAQKSELVAAIERFIASIAPMAEMYPETRHLLKPLEAGREQAELLGVPAKLLNSDAEVQEALDAEAQRNATAEAIATATAGGQAMQAMGQGAAAMKEVQGAKPTEQKAA